MDKNEDKDKHGDKDGRRSWWTTLPGVLTGVAAVLSAVTGLIIALDQLDLFSPPPPPDIAAPPPAGAKATAPAPPPLAGRTFKVDGYDGIIVRQVPIAPGRVEFALAVAPTITWWKGLKVFDRDGKMISLLATQDDDKGPKASGPLAANRFGPRIEIEFHKAKVLGVHTRVARVPFLLSDVQGFRTTFYWESD